MKSANVRKLPAQRAVVTGGAGFLGSHLDLINAHERDANVVARGMREAMQAVADRPLDPFPLLTHSFALDKLDRALTAMRDRPDGFLKATVAL